MRPNGEKANFRTWVNFRIESPLFIDYAKRLKAKRVAIIYVQLPNTDEQFNNLIIPGLKGGGIKDILVERYQMDLSDFRSIILLIRSFKPDLIILNGFPANYVPMVRALREQNMIKEGNAIASWDLVDAALVLSPDLVESIRVSVPSFVLQKKEQIEIKEWYARFEARFHKTPLYTHAFAYDMTNMIVDAAKRYLASSSPKAMSEILQETSLSGISGKLKFDEYGDLPTAVEIGVFRNGVTVQDR